MPAIPPTVRLNRHPAPSWQLGEFWSHDLCEGRVVEGDAVWETTGQLMAWSRQLALVRQAE